MSALPDTIAAPATPPGSSALAVVRVSGPEVAALTAGIFGRALTPRRAHHADYRDRAGVLVDDVVATAYAGPHSYTGEDALEISCHGNPFIVRKILDDLLARGCRAAHPGEFTQRAFLQGRMDLTQAEAVMELVQARSDRALQAAQRQLRGGLRQTLEGLTARLLDALARVEAHIDFPDEDLPPEDLARLREELGALRRETAALQATSRYGTLLREGLRVVIVGPPNVGKSSLLNRLLGRPRALVSPQPGTTRDYLEEPFLHDGFPLRLIDTAGLNDNPDIIESQGIAVSRDLADSADVLLVLVDSSLPFPELDPELRGWMARTPTLLVRNKADLPPAGPFPACPGVFADVAVSALHGDHWPALLDALSRLLATLAGAAGPEGLAISARHAAALDQVSAALHDALLRLEPPDPATELVASDLWAALAACGEISGRTENEAMLDQLFTKFCIGK